MPATWEITTTRDPSARTQELYETLLENLRGFDLDEIESMDRADLPLDWQPVENAAVAALPRTPAIQPATQRA